MIDYLAKEQAETIKQSAESGTLSLLLRCQPYARKIIIALCEMIICEEGAREDGQND